MLILMLPLKKTRCIEKARKCFEKRKCLDLVKMPSQANSLDMGRPLEELFIASPTRYAIDSNRLGYSSKKCLPG